MSVVHSSVGDHSADQTGIEELMDSPTPNNAQIETLANRLEGVRLIDPSGDANLDWIVGKKIIKPVKLTPGAFSVGYHATQVSGKVGFLKALDYQKIGTVTNVLEKIKEESEIFSAESQLLTECTTKKLSRIVQALSAGEYRDPTNSSPFPVSYVILELADGDARELLLSNPNSNYLERLRMAQDAAAALNQLHSIKATHQDLKAANFLFWRVIKGTVGKLGDLGRAHSEIRSSPIDYLPIPGDRRHSPPEYLYGSRNRLPESQFRYAADCMMLGNLICFLITGTTYNDVFYASLGALQHHSTGINFEDALPALIQAHDESRKYFSSIIYEEYEQDLIAIIEELCFPDPMYRGDPVARGKGNFPFSLGRYTTRLNLVLQRSSIAGRSINVGNR